jgi:hypothetical protein
MAGERTWGRGGVFPAKSTDHQLTVLSSNYDFAMELDLGPL